ncbi:hypothetical protein, partial [Ensifer soli]|uniref:hypothetical protein n=1 Tax=Ciceribacter sp. sgz301302 TaxID=3342379 RepID=UPI0035BA238B
SSGNRMKTLDFVPAGARNNKMVSMAGLISRAVLRGERSLMQALDEISIWVEDKVEVVVGDEITKEYAKAKLIEFLTNDVTGPSGKALPVG